MPISVQCWKTKGNIRRICPLGGSLLSELHPRLHAMWKRAIGACLFAYNTGVRALAERDGDTWAVLGLKRINLMRGRNPHCGHIHTTIDRTAKRGKKITLGRTQFSSLLEPGTIGFTWREGSTTVYLQGGTA